MTTSYEDLAARLAELAARVDGLETENAALRAEAAASRTDSPADAPAARRFDRRNLLRLGGAAAAVSAGAVMLRPEMAGVTTASLQFGAENDGGTDTTGLTSSHATDTLHVTNSSTGDNTSGSSIIAHNTDAANSAAVVKVIQDGTSDALVGQVTTLNGGAGVVGLGFDSGGVVGVTGGAAPAVAGIVANGATGVAVNAWAFDDANTAAALDAEHDGLGNAVYGHIENAANGKRAVYGLTKGTGIAMLGSITAKTNKAPAIQGSTAGSGPGLYGTSTLGVGGKFAGKSAQIQLAPSTAGSHPTAGSAGQLFVDKSGRLWYCKGGRNWKQLA